MNSGREDFAAYAVVSPPPARATRGGEGSGVGGASTRRRRLPSPRARSAWGEWSRPRERRGRAQFHQRRQESGQRFASAGRRDQERRAIVAGLCEQRQLMLARRPAAACEPAAKAVRQQLGCFVRRSGQDVGRHGPRPKPLRRFRRGRTAYFTAPRLRGEAQERCERSTLLNYSVTGLSEMSQSLPLNTEM